MNQAPLTTTATLPPLTARERIVVLLRQRGAAVDDLPGRLLPGYIFASYRGRKVFLPVIETPGSQPTAEQHRALDVARDHGWIAVSIHDADDAAMVLSAIDYARETGR